MARTQKLEGKTNNGRITLKEAETPIIEVLPEQSLPLSEDEKKDLERLEAQVKSAFLAGAKALWEINSRRLYREKYETFENYCKEQFKLSPRYIYYQVKFGQVINALEQSEQTVQILPQSEYQVRPLSKLKSETAQVDAWLEAVEKAGGKPPSFPVVEEVVREKLTSATSTKQKKEELDDKEFCRLKGQLAQVLTSEDDEYLVKNWDNSEDTVNSSELQKLSISKRSLSRVQAYFDQLGTTSTLVERSQERTATTVLAVLAKVGLPPTELETKLLKCLERELSRQDAAQSEKSDSQSSTDS